MLIQPVILAGGTGSRLWPLSRELYPKQLLNLVGDRSLLQDTLERVMQLNDIMAPILVVGEEHRFIAGTQVEEMDLPMKVHVILEPVGRNTAPAICAAANFVATLNQEPVVMLVLPADHLIRKQEAFQEAVANAMELANQKQLVTFGIKPSSPETGYGYIEKGDGNQVLSFVEKPDLQTAKNYLASGRYFWNSGMFAFRSDILLQELGKYSEEICLAMAASVAAGKNDGPFFRLDRQSMESCPSDSIDYALMEKSDQVSVVPADLDWSDIGSWAALWEISDKDSEGNVVSGDVVLEGVSNSLIRSQHSLIAGVGLQNTMVVETADAVLVASLDCSQDVKNVVAHLKTNGREEYKLHKTVYRPWGCYTILEEQENFKIKRITVKSGVKLSLQMHHHRSEHWVVVKGTAKVTCGDMVTLVKENESTYIPCGERHRLENPGVIPLEVIEVQNGSYLGEDDIVRFDDDYGRDKKS